MSDSGYGFHSFVPGPAGYEALATLATRVWPRQPASAAWLMRVDQGREPRDGFTRIVVTHASEPSRFVGVVEVARHPWSIEPHRHRLELHVDPDHRRRGLGRRLFDRALEALPPGPPALLECATREDEVDAPGFLTRRNFVQFSRNPESELALATFEAARFTAALERVANQGLTLVNLRGRTDDLELMRAVRELAVATGRDAPGAAHHDQPAFDVWRRAFVDNPDLLPELHVLAFDGARLVGLTQIWGSQATDRILYTGLTGVARSHRRRGLALALKVSSLTAARTLRGAVGAVVRTANAETNPMLAINRSLGFVQKPAQLLFEREVKKEEARP